MRHALHCAVGFILATSAAGCTRTVGTIFIQIVTSQNVDERPIPEDLGAGATVEVRVEGPGMAVLRDAAAYEGRNTELLVPGVDVGSDRVVTVTVRSASGDDVARARSLPFEVDGSDESLSLYLARVGQTSLTKTRMQARRFRHTATRLQDGRVLIAGGGERKVMRTDGAQPECCEGECSEACNCNCAGSLGDSLVVPSEPVAFAEIFDPTSGSIVTNPEACSDTNRPALCMLCETGRMAHAAAVDLDGATVLGGDETGCRHPTERFALGRFEPGPDVPLRVVEAVALSTREGVLIAGGLDLDEGTPTSRAALLTGSQVIELELSQARYAAAAAPLPGGGGAIFGGFVSDPPRGSPPDCDCEGDDCPRADCRSRGYVPEDVTGSIEVFDPDAHELEELDGVMEVPRAYFTATPLPNGRVLIVGGLGGISTLAGQKLPVTSIEQFDPETGVSCQVGNLNLSRWMHAAYATADGRVVIIGGYEAPVEGSFGLLADTILILAVRGDCESENTSIITFGRLRVERAGHTVTPLDNGAVLIAGGVTNDGSVTDTMEILWLD